MPRLPTPEQHKAMRLYADLLEEAKLRINCIESALNGRISLPGPILHELCFLQLRFLCELIALGCLVVHGDIKATQKSSLRKEWSAENIIERLGELHPAFYPIPHMQEKTTSGFHLTNIQEDYLAKNDLVALYAECNRHLHRGSLKKILKSSQPTQFNFPDVLKPAQQIGKLLTAHRISLFQEGTVLLVGLRNMENNERVQVAFASATT